MPRVVSMHKHTQPSVTFCMGHFRQVCMHISWSVAIDKPDGLLTGLDVRCHVCGPVTCVPNYSKVLAKCGEYCHVLFSVRAVFTLEWFNF